MNRQPTPGNPNPDLRRMDLPQKVMLAVAGLGLITLLVAMFLLVGMR
jgi:hypothetical protein